MVNIQGIAWLASGDVCVIITHDGYDFKSYIKSFKGSFDRNEMSEIIETAHHGSHLNYTIAKLIIQECGRPTNIVTN